MGAKLRKKAECAKHLLEILFFNKTQGWRLVGLHPGDKRLYRMCPCVSFCVLVLQKIIPSHPFLAAWGVAVYDEEQTWNTHYKAY
jgi:hypothetical protein